MLLMQAAAVSVFAQDKPKAGDIISGFVDDDYGPLMMTTVNERDAADRIVAHCITANDGSFSFKLVNPKDRLVITYVGYEKVDIPIFDSGLGTSFRTRLIEELDVLCRLAARFKHYYEKPALTEDAF